MNRLDFADIRGFDAAYRETVVHVVVAEALACDREDLSPRRAVEDAGRVIARAAWKACVDAARPQEQVPAIAPGDVVQLKSGGPLMNVRAPWADDPQEADADPAPRVWCLWWNASSLESVIVPVSCLRRVDAPVSSATGAQAIGEPDEREDAVTVTVGARAPDGTPPAGHEFEDPLFTIWRRPLRKVKP